MKHSQILLAIALLSLSGCGKKHETSQLTSGIVRDYMDLSARPQDDFGRYANGKWMDKTEISADKTRIGSFIDLRDEAEEDVRKIIDELAQSTELKDGSDEQRVADFFRSYMNLEKRNKLGLAPLKEELTLIDSIQNTSDLLACFGQGPITGISSPIATYVSTDAKNSTRYTVYLTQSGLGLPDRDYYLNDNERFTNIRQDYLKYIETLFELANLPKPASTAATVLNLETQIATLQWTRVQNRDRDKTYNKLNTKELGELTSTLDWNLYFEARDLGEIKELVVRQPDYLKAIAPLIESTPLDDWKTYLTFQVLDGNAPYLNQAFDDAQFAFHGKILSGQEQQEDLWKRGVKLINGQLGEIVGKIYVARHFKQEAKDRMVALVENLRTAYARSINEIEWMSEATKEEAKAKLAAFNPKIGYPDIWEDYDGLTIRTGDLMENLRQARLHRHMDNKEKLGGPVRRWEWGMNPQTVNAYYNPTLNEIVFPAAILQPPFFNMEADDAANYGAIGAVIGHEMGHGFDDQGSKSDAEGNLRDWWTDSDREEFKKRTSNLVEQYSAYRPFEDLAVNGELTLGENIGDLAGVTIAYKAYQISLNGKEAPVIDNLTGDQRFFLSWAQCWRGKSREETVRKQIATDPHSPPEFRIIGPLSNLPQFHKAFAIKPGDAMYLPPEKHVSIW
jgi:putative endopeptidase